MTIRRVSLNSMLVSSLCALASMAIPGSAFALNEGGLYYVNDHDSAGACGGDDVTEGFNQTDYLRDAMVTWGWDRTSLYANAGVDFQDIADVNVDANGDDAADPSGIDSADVGMIYTHGNYDGCTSDTSRSTISMGSNAAACTVSNGTTSSSNDVDWGDTDLNVMIITTCNSLQLCVFEDGGYFTNSDSLGIVLGFHGTAYDSGTHTNNFENFVDSSRYDGVGDNWVDKLTRRPIGADNDECGVAVVYGATTSDRDNIYNNGGLQDWKTVTATGTAAMYFISGCDPDTGNEL